MTEIIFEEAICQECEEVLPRFTIAEVVSPEFIVCLECNEAINDSYELMLSERC